MMPGLALVMIMFGSVVATRRDAACASGMPNAASPNTPPMRPNGTLSRISPAVAAQESWKPISSRSAGFYSGCSLSRSARASGWPSRTAVARSQVSCCGWPMWRCTTRSAMGRAVVCGSTRTARKTPPELETGGGRGWQSRGLQGEQHPSNFIGRIPTADRGPLQKCLRCPSGPASTACGRPCVQPIVNV